MSQELIRELKARPGKSLKKRKQGKFNRDESFRKTLPGPKLF
jgi:hypothetical protein